MHRVGDADQGFAEAVTRIETEPQAVTAQLRLQALPDAASVPAAMMSAQNPGIARIDDAFARVVDEAEGLVGNPVLVLDPVRSVVQALAPFDVAVIPDATLAAERGQDAIARHPFGKTLQFDQALGRGGDARGGSVGDQPVATIMPEQSIQQVGQNSDKQQNKPLELGRTQPHQRIDETEIHARANAAGLSCRTVLSDRDRASPPR